MTMNTTFMHRKMSENKNLHFLRYMNKTKRILISLCSKKNSKLSDN